MSIDIYYSPRFEKAFKKCTKVIKEKAFDCEDVFRNDPFDKKLKTHKLRGALKNYYSFSINHSYRVVFSFEDDNTVIFHDIGGHEIYK